MGLLLLLLLLVLLFVLLIRSDLKPTLVRFLMGPLKTFQVCDAALDLRPMAKGMVK